MPWPKTRYREFACIQAARYVSKYPVPQFPFVEYAAYSVFQHYGAHLGPTRVPLVETMPRYEDHGENFYYDQEDFMFDLASKRNWTWNIIRPDAIIGFTPSGR